MSESDDGGQIESLVVPGEGEFIVGQAKTIEETRSLIEAGFEYVCDVDGVKVFRKSRRKFWMLNEDPRTSEPLDSVEEVSGLGDGGS